MKTSFPNLFINNEDENYEWNYFRNFQLNSRATNVKFNDSFLLTSTYFLTVEIYNLETEQFMQQLIGHACSVTCFDFSQELMLVVTGSADNTIKYWNLDCKSTNVNDALIASEADRVWPVKINIERYKTDDSYLIIALCTHGYIYVNHLLRIEDFVPVSTGNGANEFDTFNFKLRLKFLKIYVLDVGVEQLNEIGVLLSNRSRLKLKDNTLVAYLVSENNSNQHIKMFIKKWDLIENEDEQLDEFGTKENIDMDMFDFLNQKSIKSCQINAYEIIAFGFSYCLFVDDNNLIYLANLKQKSIKRIQNELSLSDRLKIFHLSSSIGQEQFLFSAEQSWLDGYECTDTPERPVNKSIAFAFYTQRINEAFCVLWNNKS